MFRKVAFTMYPVRDVARARRFYEETLGLQAGMAGGQDGMHWIEYDLPEGGCLAARGGTRGGLSAGICGLWQGAPTHAMRCHRGGGGTQAEAANPRARRVRRRGPICRVALAQRWHRIASASRALHLGPRRSNSAPREFHHGLLALTNTTGDTPSAAAGGTVALEVADLDRLMAELGSKGVELTSEVIRGPRCRMAVCLDSEGNSILLHQLDRRDET